MGNWGYPWQRNKNPLAIPPGSKRNEILIQAKTNAPDPTTGAPSNVWATVLVAMAKMRTLTQREVFQAGQIVGQVTHEIALDWPGLTVPIAGGMRVVHLGSGLAFMGDLASSTTISNATPTAALAKGQALFGVGIPAGVTIAGISGETLTISSAATATAEGVALRSAPRMFLVQTPENVQERNRVLLLHCLEIDGTA